MFDEVHEAVYIDPLGDDFPHVVQPEVLAGDRLELGSSRALDIVNLVNFRAEGVHLDVNELVSQGLLGIVDVLDGLIALALTAEIHAELVLCLGKLPPLCLWNCLSSSLSGTTTPDISMMVEVARRSVSRMFSLALAHFERSGDAKDFSSQLL